MTRFLLVLGLFVGAVAAAPMAARNGDVPEPPALQLDQLAERFVDAHARLPYLKMRVDVTDLIEVPQPDGTNKRDETAIVVLTDMAPGKLRTVVFDNAQALHSIVTFENGRVREYRPFFDFGGENRLNNAVIEYDAPYHYGTKNVYLKTAGERCQWGAYLNTWLGESAGLVETLALKISLSESVEEVEFEGTPAYRFTRVRINKDPETGFEERYVEHLTVEKERMLVLSFIGIQHQQDATITRTRTYTILSAGALPEETRWQIELPADAQLTLASIPPARKEAANEVKDRKIQE